MEVAVKNAVLLVLLLGVMVFQAHAQTNPTVTISITSSPGDPIGLGQSYTLTADVDTVHVYRNFQGGVGVYWNNADYSKWWQFDFVSADRGPLAAGTYSAAEKFPRQSAGHPGLFVSSFHSWTCTSIDGSFSVKKVTADPSGRVISFWVVFTQSCDEAPALHGEIRYDLDQSVSTRATSWGRLKGLYR